MSTGEKWRLWGAAFGAGVLGAIAVLGLKFGIDELIDPTSAEGTSNEVGEQEPSLDDAIHAAAEEAVEIEDGKYKGEPFKIARIEVTANNPHITAYRVVLEK